MKESMKNKWFSATNLPRDVVLGIPIVTIVGVDEFYVENYIGILEYTDQIVRVQTKIGTLSIHGIMLQINYYTDHEMKITGNITSVQYDAKEDLMC